MSRGRLIQEVAGVRRLQKPCFSATALLTRQEPLATKIADGLALQYYNSNNNNNRSSKTATTVMAGENDESNGGNRNITIALEKQCLSHDAEWWYYYSLIIAVEAMPRYQGNEVKYQE